MTATAAASATSAACSAPHPTVSDDDIDGQSGSDRGAGSTTRFFMEPINALRKAASVLLYTTPDAPPAIHTPQPPEGPLPRLQYPVVLVHGFLGQLTTSRSSIQSSFTALRSVLFAAPCCAHCPSLSVSARCCVSNYPPSGYSSLLTNPINQQPVFESVLSSPQLSSAHLVNSRQVNFVIRVCLSYSAERAVVAVCMRRVVSDILVSCVACWRALGTPS